MQDIISTLKNALQQAEAGLEVAVGRLAKDGTERGDFKPSEVLALASVREALAMPVTCVHQIQEPAPLQAAPTQALTGEARAEAIRRLAPIRSKLAAAVPAMAVPDERAAFESWALRCAVNVMYCEPDNQYLKTSTELLWQCWLARAALAATPAAAPDSESVLIEGVAYDVPAAVAAELLRLHIELLQPSTPPVVLPEPVGWRHSRTLTLHETEEEVQLADGDSHAQPLFTEQQVRALLATAPALRAMPVTEEMHVAAVKVLQRASGLDGLPQRMLDAMVAVAPAPADVLAAATGLPTQAVPIKLIEAINKASRGNEWQGDALATDLLEPACRAIASLAPQAQAKPVAWTVGGEVTNWRKDFSKYKTQHYVRPVFSAPMTVEDARAAELLGFLQDQCIDLRCFTTSDGEDVGWRTVQHHMDKPHERVVSEVCSDDPRRAIREAMARIERDPYCTGPLHLEDDAAIAAAKGE